MIGQNAERRPKIGAHPALSPAREMFLPDDSQEVSQPHICPFFPSKKSTGRSAACLEPNDAHNQPECEPGADHSTLGF